MKNSERNARTLHLTATLDSQLLSNAVVKSATRSLEKATSTLDGADADERAKKEAVRAASARVRDAADKAFDECRRAGAALIVKDPSFDEKLAPGEGGRKPSALLARSYRLLEDGQVLGVALPDLVAARSELSDAAGARASARSARKAGRAARKAAETAWDAAYVAARAAVDGALAGDGLTGRKLLEAAQRYFPKQVRHKRGGPAAPAAGEKPAAETKPAA